MAERNPQGNWDKADNQTRSSNWKNTTNPVCLIGKKITRTAIKMSLIIGNGMCITYDETEVTCPICTFKFDAGKRIESARYPLFRTKCPACKGAIGISVPIFGGNTECFEWATSPNVERLRTVTPNKINGRIVRGRQQEDDDDLDDGEEVCA